ncbi:ABC transporter permease [Mesorhizobium sp. INR15]|uniref:ABC transporter permease n=1 Tax=Mesorhizobium sp. INR15 TaxID=2654248 RepID=UPI0018968F8E|nr:ABC transporter permease [Mesorhizobium sp. INR15]QPC94559.1 ABC transporter permease [Mesorhizobium sp. INR15]
MSLLPDIGLITVLLASGVRLATPIGFAALGGVLAERGGVYNVGLEGMMLWGAFGAAAGTYLTGSPVVGLVAGILLGAAAGLLLALLCVTLAVNQLVAGIAINLLCAGLTAFLARATFGLAGGGTAVSGFAAFPIPYLSGLPVIGPALFSQDPLAYMLPVLVAAVAFCMYRTQAGLRLRAAGESPRAADSAGVNVTAIRYVSLALSGACAAAGGCHLVLCQVYIFSEGMSAGKGFIALAAIILGRWHPVGAVVAALFFGLCDALQLQLQFSNPLVPYQIFLILPFAASLVALVWFNGGTRQPAATGKVFDRESR